MAIVRINIEGCHGEEYVLFPACCYNGNQFDVLKKDYPPVFKPDECGPLMKTTITDVPRLNKDGSGMIEVTSGDLSVPCVGVWLKDKNECIFVFTLQEIKGKNIGIAYEKGTIRLSYPAMRAYKYQWPHMMKNDETYEESPIDIPYKMIQEPCTSMEEFYNIFFDNRKIMGLDDTLPQVLSKEEQTNIQLKKYNQMNWFEDQGYYGSNVHLPEGVPGGVGFSAGWIGGGISSYAMMKLGGDMEYKRAVKTLDYLFEHQGESGLFYASTLPNGEIQHDGFGADYAKNYTLTRRSADVLYFLFKHFDLMKEIPEFMREGTRKCADAFVNLWKTYGQIGQFVDVETGEIKAGGSVSGGLVPASLISAYRYFNEIEYLEVAKAVGQHYYDHYLVKGYTSGGPAEILQCPDSESAFLLLESYVELYDMTREQKWLDYAEFAAKLCSSWVVSYNYKFPEGSEFNHLDMKTIGSIFANAQNKHSAPGICTLSGTSLRMLYTFTNNEDYHQLYKEITRTISQYMSTDKRPVTSWDVPKDASIHHLNDVIVERERLPQGYICERVNMSDWETYRCIGGVFKGSCWPEVSNMLVLAED